MLSSHYFSVQKFTFAGVGINLTTASSDLKKQQHLIKKPVLLYGMLFLSFFHLILVTHYACIHITDFIEITDCMPLLCQLLLCILKVTIFLYKREEIVLLIRQIHNKNSKAEREELAIVRRENDKDNFLCTLYFRMVLVTGSFGVMHPVIYGVYVYFTRNEIVLNESNKASYFWNYAQLSGYSVVYFLNVFSIYFTCVVSLAFDTLFSWFVSNIVSQFHIICYRFEQLARKCSEKVEESDQLEFKTHFIACVQYHRQTLFLTGKLNHVYGEIIFIKFIIVCSEICCLVFRVSHPNDSIAEVAYKGLFLSAVALQLILYCWNGQRIKDESLQLSIGIYCAFDWSNLPKSCKKEILLSILRSQRSSYVKGVFFEVDLSLYLWVFKTAGSLLTALKTLDENQA